MTQETPAAPPAAPEGNLFEAPAAPPVAPNASHLATLVGSGKKYGTVEDLAKAALEKDNFIEQLKSENAQMRAAIGKTADTDTVVKTILDRLNVAPPVIPPANATPEARTEVPRAVDPYDIAKLVREQLNHDNRVSTETSNEQTAHSEMVKAFGSFDKAKAATFDKAKQLGMSVADLQGVARKSPAAFLEIMGVQVKPANNGPDLHRIPEQTRTPEGSVRNEAYYSELRRKIGNAKFFKPDVQLQLMKDKVALGSNW